MARGAAGPDTGRFPSLLRSTPPDDSSKEEEVYAVPSNANFNLPLRGLPMPRISSVDSRMPWGGGEPVCRTAVAMRLHPNRSSTST